MKYDVLEEAYYFVSDAPPGDHLAVVHRDSGEVFCSSESADYNEIPKEAGESDDYLWIPHKNDLNLGMALVMDFVTGRCADLYDQVLKIFRRKGAYGRFKRMLEESDLLDEWYAFEGEKTKEALIKWAAENDLKLE